MYKKITICSQIKNRLHQFKDTFCENVETINKYDYDINWTIVDINSDDGLDSFLYDFLQKYNKTNINYYKLIDNIDYSIPIAKNFALRLSFNSNFLFNLDVDNYIDNAIDNILEIKENYHGMKCSTTRLGVYGRLGVHEKALKITGGYDETFLPAAGHENDLIYRLNMIGYSLQHYDCHKLPIQNSKVDTIKNTRHNNMSWEMMNKINQNKIIYNINNKIVSPNKTFTRASFIHNFIKKVELTNEYYTSE
jgi:hypothetical protein